MPSTPYEILHFACTLTQQQTETAHRCAVSRAYYSVFHHGLKVIDAKLPQTKNLVYSGGCHKQLYDKLVDGRSPEWISIAYRVDELKKKRISADYHLDETIPVHIAQESIARAQEIIQALDAI